MIKDENLKNIKHHVIHSMGSHHAFIYRINLTVSSITLKSEMSTILKPYFLSSVSHQKEKINHHVIHCMGSHHGLCINTINIKLKKTFLFLTVS